MSDEILYSEFPDAGLAVDKLDPEVPALVVAADKKHPVLVSISTYNGESGVDFRQLYPNKKAGRHEGVPVFSRTRQGARVPVAEFDDLLEYLLAIADDVHALAKMEEAK